MNNVFEVFLMYLLAFIFGIALEVTILFITFVSLRIFAGGAHLSTYVRCLFFSVGLMNIGGYVAHLFTGLTQSTFPFLLVVFIVGIFAFISCWIYAPADHYRNMSEKKKRKMRQTSFTVIVFWVVIAGFLMFYMPLNLVIASTLGILLEALMIFPFSFSMFKKVDQWIEKAILARKQSTIGE